MHRKDKQLAEKLSELKAAADADFIGEDRCYADFREHKDYGTTWKASINLEEYTAWAECGRSVAPDGTFDDKAINKSEIADVKHSISSEFVKELYRVFGNIHFSMWNGMSEVWSGPVSDFLGEYFIEPAVTGKRGQLTFW